jgi:hypothetical protein
LGEPVRPCQTMAPVFGTSAVEFELLIRFAKVNIDAEKEFAKSKTVSCLTDLAV